MIDEPSEHPPADLDLPGVQVWNVYRAHLERRIGPVFARSDAQMRTMTCVAGLLSLAERKKSRQLAEACGVLAGEPTARCGESRQPGKKPVHFPRPLQPAGCG